MGRELEWERNVWRKYPHYTRVFGEASALSCEPHYLAAKLKKSKAKKVKERENEVYLYLKTIASRGFPPNTSSVVSVTLEGSGLGRSQLGFSVLQGPLNLRFSTFFLRYLSS